jgi:A/G-specific adenine glycosylase
MKRSDTGRNHKIGAKPTERLLEWYDAYARALPWRMTGGKRADPYRVWLSEIMLQQTVVKTVIPYFETFVARFPTIDDLARAERDEVLRLWAGLGYYSRARNLHACAQKIVSEHQSQFPKSIEALKKLPGIGAYTAGAIASIAFNQKEAAIDGNVERVITRLYALDRPVTELKDVIRKKVEALIPEDRPGDFAQAMMDLGATICIPKAPRCSLCPIMKNCAAFKAGEPTLYPVRQVKKAKPHRYGAAFILKRMDGAVLLEDRPDQGLLGGMTGVPTSPWQELELEEDVILNSAPVKGRWQKLEGVVTHVFTHFHLTLSVYHADAPKTMKIKSSHRWSSSNGPEGEALPTVFRKVIALAKA